MRILYIILIIIIAFPAVADGESTEGANEYTVGTITLSPPEAYIIVEDAKTKKKRLYKKDEYEKSENRDLIAVETIELDTIEYRYMPVEGGVEFISKEFELIEIKETTAVLKRDYAETPEMEEEIPEVPMIEETIELMEEAMEEEAEQEGIAKRLVAELFYKIESEKISDTEWEVNLPSLLGAADNFGRVLGIVTEKVAGLLEPEKTAKIYFKSSIGKGALGPDGLLIESLSAGLKSKCGIEDKDLIKTVNGKSLRTIQDVAALFSAFSASPQTVTVKLLRDESDLTLTYYIR
jgi:hypothetical protein